MLIIYVILSLLLSWPPFYFSYTWVYRKVSAIDPARRAPLGDFARAEFLSVGWLMLAFVIQCGMGIPISIFRGNVIVEALIAGLCLWIVSVDIRRWFRYREMRRAHRLRNPRPPFHFSIQELLLLVFGVGVTMMFWKWLTTSLNWAGLGTLFVFCTTSQIVCFWAMMDVFRLCPDLTMRARLKYLSLQLMLAGLLPALPCYVVSWLGWRRQTWGARDGLPRKTAFRLKNL